MFNLETTEWRAYDLKAKCEVDIESIDFENNKPVLYFVDASDEQGHHDHYTLEAKDVKLSINIKSWEEESGRDKRNTH